jgi:hypothetical protein
MRASPDHYAATTAIMSGFLCAPVHPAPLMKVAERRAWRGQYGNFVDILGP